MESLEYESDIRIDQDALDIEWLEQPSLVFRYSKNLAERKRIVEKLKTEIDLIKADLDKEIRLNPEAFEIIKLTETTISNTVLQQKEYKNIYRGYIDARYELNIAQAAVDAVEHRKSALENLVRLFGQQYFAGPKIPRDLGKEWEEKERGKRSNYKVAEKLKRNK